MVTPFASVAGAGRCILFPEVSMAEHNRTIIGIFAALLIIVIVAFAWWWLSRGGDEGPVEALVQPTPTAVPVPTPSLEERLSERLAGTTLSTSDAVIRELASGLSSNPKFAAWLVNDDLIRRFTAAVDNIAAGQSPRDQLEFLRPKKGFKVKPTGDDTFVIDPASYDRYDAVAAVFAGLDTDGTIALYRELKPLIDDAYAEISPPGRRFNDRLDKAFDQLLAVPVLEGPQEVEQLIVTYAWSDDELEGLSAAQRQFLRMGPENVATIQAKLGEIRAALAAQPEE
jgi:hypothetical protein